MSKKGALSNLALSVVITIVTLFVGLYMVSKVENIANLSCSTQFGSVNTALVSNTSTIYDVLILVVIIVSLGVAIGVLRGMSGSAPGVPTSI